MAERRRRPDLNERFSLHPLSGEEALAKVLGGGQEEGTVERKRKVPGPDGQPVDATEIGFRGSGEYWNEYLLDDGTVVRLKPIVTQVFRLDGMHDDDGQPLYLMKSNNIMVVSAPDEMTKKEGDDG